MKIGEIIYKAEQEKAAASGDNAAADGNGANDDGKVVDATFDEVDEKKRNEG